MSNKKSVIATSKLIAYMLVPLVFASMSSAEPDRANPQARDRDLAQRILQDGRMDTVLRMGHDLLKSGMNAGSGYGEVWIRDLNTFIVPLLDVTPQQHVRKALLTFFHHQGEDGNIADGYTSPGPGFEAKIHKNTVETDQESSLMQAVCRYIRKTGDRGILDEVVREVTVRDRLEMALEYPLKHRFSEEHGLIWGGTTVDWGDVQPEDNPGVDLNEHSHRAIDIYDNALLIAALDEYLETVCADDPARKREWEKVRQNLYANTRKHLWDESNGKFIPHVYLEGSPFPDDFEENRIFYHGGTAVAIEAELLTRDEILASYWQMRRNVELANAATIGLTIYPTYPLGFFKNPYMSNPYSYQNGGDWTWFGGRMVRQLARHGFAEESYRELEPMLDRVLKHGFFEWWTPANKPRGSAQFRGSAGVLIEAIHELREWARAKS